jgi:hypothetical protein
MSSAVGIGKNVAELTLDQIGERIIFGWPGSIELLDAVELAMDRYGFEKADHFLNLREQSWEPFYGDRTMVDYKKDEDLEKEVEIEDRLEKLSELLSETDPADIDAMIEKHKAEIDKLLRFKKLLVGKTPASGKNERMNEIKEIFQDNGNQYLSIVDIAHILDCKPQSISVCIMRAKGVFEKKDKKYRLANFQEEEKAA